MFRLSGDFIYTLSGQLRPLENIKDGAPRMAAFLALHNAEQGLKDLLAGNSLGLKVSLSTGQDLYRMCRQLLDEVLEKPENAQKPLPSLEVFQLKETFSKFEVTLKAELAIGNFYAATPKGAYDISLLAENGLSSFPSSLAEKVPEAVSDAKQAARCLAFDLPTAAAFHMHRAHEAVVHKYFEAIAPAGQPTPKRQALGSWVKALEEAKAPEEIVTAIRDITKLHRNPVLHPEHSLKDSEEAIALLGSICTSMHYMLPRIVAKSQGA